MEFVPEIPCGGLGRGRKSQDLLVSAVEVAIGWGHWPASLAQQVISKPGRDLFFGNKVDRFSGTTSEAGIWPKHSHTHTGTLPSVN